MNIKIPQTKYEVLPVGEYGALVESIEQVAGQYGNQLKIRFAIRAPADYAGQVLIGWCSATFSPRSKLYQWTQAIAFEGAPIPDDYDFDSSHLIARPCRLVVITKQGSEGSEFSKIESIKPIRKAAAVKAPPAPAPRPAAAAAGRTPPASAAPELDAWFNEEGPGADLNF